MLRLFIMGEYRQQADPDLSVLTCMANCKGIPAESQPERRLESMSKEKKPSAGLTLALLILLTLMVAAVLGGLETVKGMIGPP